MDVPAIAKGSQMPGPAKENILTDKLSEEFVDGKPEISKKHTELLSGYISVHSDVGSVYACVVGAD